MNWQPIESAPKDGTCILALWKPKKNSIVDGRSYAVTCWYGCEWGNPDDRRDCWADPNYWMPLPPPPESP